MKLNRREMLGSTVGLALSGWSAKPKKTGEEVSFLGCVSCGERRLEARSVGGFLLLTYTTPEETEVFCNPYRFCVLWKHITGMFCGIQPIEDAAREHVKGLWRCSQPTTDFLLRQAGLSRRHPTIPFITM